MMLGLGRLLRSAPGPEHISRILPRIFDRPLNPGAGIYSDAAELTCRYCGESLEHAESVEREGVREFGSEELRDCKGTALIVRCRCSMTSVFEYEAEPR